MRANFFRREYRIFVYQGFETKLTKEGDFKVVFSFKILPDINFRPKVIIKGINQTQLKRVGQRVINNLVFHLGLIESLSYWKATCSPVIEIRAGQLNKEQIRWWKKIIEKGMGQFFYENKIGSQKPRFCPSEVGTRKVKVYKRDLNSEKVLMPISGGKDSIVALELLKNTRQNIQCFSLNPSDSIKGIMKIAGCQEPIIIERKIDENLLKLNQKGFLNGHTPFSAYLAFLSVFLAVLFDIKYIAFSNERSSNEGNIKYLGKVINHQWSKTFEFEKMFRHYSKKYLAREVEYFSFLRPFYEIQIGRIFTKNCQKYFRAFMSCNEAGKTYSGTKEPSGRWCGKCPKCLFVFVCLYPFVKEKELIKIFGRNLFEKKELLPIMQQLIGKKGFKPFECVGTKKECLVVFFSSLTKFQRSRIFCQAEKLPVLLRYFKERILPKYPSLKKESKKILNSWNRNNFLAKKFETILKDEIKKFKK